MMMREPNLEAEEPVDMTRYVTEDDEPVDSVFCESQHRLLVHLLYTSWPEGRPFMATADVGLFYRKDERYPVVPDFLLSLGVEALPLSDAPESKSYFLWVYKKAPELVVEVVSNTKGGELGRKREIYESIGVQYYAVYDPFGHLSSSALRVYRLEDGRYSESGEWMPEISLGLKSWEGQFEGKAANWLRFCREDGSLLETGEEAVERLKARVSELEER